MQMPEIPGYEYTGEYRKVEPGEISVNLDNAAEMVKYRTAYAYPILRKTEKWVPVTLAKAAELLVTQKLFMWKSAGHFNAPYRGKIAQITWIDDDRYCVTLQCGRRTDLDNLLVLAE